MYIAYILIYSLSMYMYNTYVRNVDVCIRMVWICMYTYGMDVYVYIWYGCVCIRMVWMCMYTYGMDVYVYVWYECVCIHMVWMCMYTYGMDVYVYVWYVRMYTYGMYVCIGMVWMYLHVQCVYKYYVDVHYILTVIGGSMTMILFSPVAIYRAFVNLLFRSALHNIYNIIYMYRLMDGHRGGTEYTQSCF